jgi:hypothetical protein
MVIDILDDLKTGGMPLLVQASHFLPPVKNKTIIIYLSCIIRI